MILWIVILNTFYTDNMHNNKLQVQLGQIVHVHQAIFVILCKNVYIFVCLYVQIQRCDIRLVVFHLLDYITSQSENMAFKKGILPDATDKTLVFALEKWLGFCWCQKSLKTRMHLVKDPPPTLG